MDEQEKEQQEPKLQEQQPRETRETLRPRDEDFSRTPLPVRNPEKKTYDPRPKPWVILLIVLLGVLSAVTAVVLFYLKGRNKTAVIDFGEVTAAEESFTREGQTESETEAESRKPHQDSYVDGDVSESGSETEEESGEEDSAEETSSETESEEEEETTESPEKTEQEETSSEEEDWRELEYGGIIVTISGGEANLQKCYSSDHIIELPGEIDGALLTGISENCFNGCAHLTHIDIENGMISIGSQAFANCENLREIVIPDSVVSIADDAFYNTPGVIILGHLGQYSESYAASHGLGFTEGDRPTVLTGP